MITVHLTIGHNVRGVPTWDVPTIAARVATVLHVEALTAVPCFGYYQGEPEESTRVEIASLDETEAARIESLIHELSRDLKQECIMFEKFASQAMFL